MVPPGGAFFEVLHSSFSADAEPLDARERAVLQGRLNVESMLRPRGNLDVFVVRDAGDASQDVTGLPVQGGSPYRDTVWPFEASCIARLLLRSTVGSVDGARHDGGRAEVVTVVLRLTVSSDPPVRRELVPLRNLLRARTPVLLDAVRQANIDRAEKARPAVGPGPRHAAAAPPVTRAFRGQRTQAALVGMHWLEVGGAERWAMETVDVLRGLGLETLVLTDRLAAQTQAAHPLLRECNLLTLDAPLTRDQDTAFLTALIDRYDFRIIHVHHCSWLYARLPFLRAHYPSALIVDSLHIEEWQTGGFVQIGARATSVVNVHHTTSPALVERLTVDYGIESKKVALRPLTDLSGEKKRAFQAPRPDRRQPRTVTFLGRLSPQKRPFLFVDLVKRLQHLPNIRFIMHGSGELQAETDALIERAGLGHRIDVRRSDAPLQKTYDDTDLLVNTSENEGLTLASVEAIAAGCLLISTDVGSQASLNARELLLPRHPLPLLRTAVRLVTEVWSDEELRSRVHREQRQLVTTLQSLEGARSWATNIYEGAMT